MLDLCLPTLLTLYCYDSQKYEEAAGSSAEQSKESFRAQVV